MATIITRQTTAASVTPANAGVTNKGAPLTNAELDTNLIQLNYGITSNVAITGGTITGITDLAVADGGTGLSSLTAGYIPYGAGTSAYASTANLQYLVQYSAGANPIFYSTNGVAAGTGTLSYPTTNTGVGFYSRGSTSNGGVLVQDGQGRLNQYWNAYTDSGGVKYIVTGEPAARYLMSVNSTTGASHAWYGAPSGTAGTTLTWTTMANWVSGTAGFAWISPRGTSSDFYIDINGNVGLGTTTPFTSTTTFGIAKSPVTTDGGYYGGGVYWDGSGWKNTTSSQGGWVIRNSTGAYTVWTGSSPGAAGNTVTDFAERMRIDSAGNVLINSTVARTNLNSTNTPVLQTEGITANTSAYAVIRNTNDSNPSRLWLAKSRGTSVGSNTIVQNNDVVGTIAFTGSDGTNFIYTATIDSIVNGTPGTNDMPGALLFSTTPDGSPTPSERMRIDNAGNVGIGTTSPSSYGKLAVVGTAGQLFTVTDSLTGTLFSANDVSGIPSIEVLDTGVVKLAQYSGNVGIGTASPAYKLDVTGTTRISGATTLSSTLAVTGATTLSSTLAVTGAITAPTHIGGSAVTSTLTLQSTSGIGTTDQILFKTSNNGSLTPLTINNASGSPNLTVAADLLFTDATYDIGKSGATRPRDIFLSRNLTIGGTTSFGGNIISNLLFTDNTYDIGASGATRPRTLYAGTSVVTPSLLVSTTTAVANTTGAVSVTYSPGSTTGQAYFATGGNTQGGSGFFDFLKVTNTGTSATNPD
jgi:hypothetical protein